MAPERVMAMAIYQLDRLLPEEVLPTLGSERL